jgi:hypothetical protein
MFIAMLLLSMVGVVAIMFLWAWAVQWMLGHGPMAFLCFMAGIVLTLISIGASLN